MGWMHRIRKDHRFIGGKVVQLVFMRLDEAACFAGSSLRDTAFGVRCSMPRRCSRAISPNRVWYSMPHSRAIHAPTARVERGGVSPGQAPEGMVMQWSATGLRPGDRGGSRRHRRGQTPARGRHDGETGGGGGRAFRETATRPHATVCFTDHAGRHRGESGGGGRRGIRELRNDPRAKRSRAGPVQRTASGCDLVGRKRQTLPAGSRVRGQGCSALLWMRVWMRGWDGVVPRVAAGTRSCSDSMKPLLSSASGYASASRSRLAGRHS
jgi:hypothetical protein